MRELKAGRLIDLFPALNQELINFINGLDPTDWARQTICPLWKVKDVVAHLLDGNIRRISIYRDEHFAPFPEVNSYGELVAQLNEMNRLWVEAMKRTSPALLIQLLELTNPMFQQALKSKLPEEKAVFPVAWAGEETSSHLMDVAREYTEKWLHQQQIRDVFGDTVLLTEKFYKPCLETFLQAIPVAFAADTSPGGSCVNLRIEGLFNADYHLVKGSNGWKVYEGNVSQADCTISMTADTSWKLFSKGVKDQQQAKALITVVGRQSLAEHILNTVAVMA